MLHALMMCSDPSYILLKANTLACIEEIRNFRNETKLPLYFTLDAGPNLHLLYPEVEAQKIGSFIQNVLMPYAENGRIITDKAGPGPVQLL